MDGYMSKARIDAISPKQDWLYPWGELNNLLDEQFAFLLIAEISAHYEHMEEIYGVEGNEDYRVGLLEKKLVRTAVDLFPSLVRGYFDRAALLREAREREHKLHQIRWRERAWYDLGIEWPAD
jgi:hypothetical protein